MQEIAYGSPKECGLPKPAVNALAENLAEQLKYRPGDPLEPLVSSLGGRIEYQDFWELESSSSGSIQIQEKGDFVVYLAAHTGPLRDRFTIAHELGHYVLHYLLPNSRGSHVGPIQAQRYGSGRAEWEANWFAAGFLMPTESFRRALEESGYDLVKVADQFGVSLQAAQVRAQSLGHNISL